MNLNTPENISTKRTAVNITVIGYILYGLNMIFGWHLDITDKSMIVVMPVIGFVWGIGYRLSRFATNKWPSLGWVLFGSGQEPLGIKKIGD